MRSGVDAGGERAFRRLDADAVVADRAQVLAAREQRHLCSRAGEKAREETAYSSTTGDGDAHDRPLSRLANPALRGASS